MEPWAELLSEEDGHTVIALACEESATCRVTRRVNALVLLEDGRSRQERESTEDAEPYRATSQSRRRTMLTPNCTPRRLPAIDPVLSLSPE
jgi:hypothetical protein